MSDDLDLDAVMAAAEQAAGSGDFAAAERHLVDAARLQEQALGPAHPDLANTLNNLGVVYERTGRTDDAEASYRRAYAIARETLAPDHPFVATSAENLREFCTTNGRPFDVSDTSLLGVTAQSSTKGADEAQSFTESQESERTPSPLFVEERAFRSTRPDDSASLGLKAQGSADNQERQAEPAVPSVEERAFKPARTSASTSPTVAARARSARRRTLLLFASVAAVIVIWLFARPRSGPPSPAPAATSGDSSAAAPNAPASPSTAATPAPDQTSSSSETSALAAAPSVFTPDARPSSPSGSSTPAASAGAPAASTPPAPAPAPRPARAASSAPPAPAPFPTATRADAAAAGVTVVRADVCAHFSTRTSDWRCDAVGATADAGVLVFYTRIRSPRGTTVEHRWYRGDTVVQSVRLRIGANSGAGYRTYSRNTVGSGAWRVELRASDGTLLHEARFTVR
jgi:hypothetical protein